MFWKTCAKIGAAWRLACLLLRGAHVFRNMRISFIYGCTFLFVQLYLNLNAFKIEVHKNQSGIQLYIGYSPVSQQKLFVWQSGVFQVYFGFLPNDLEQFLLRMNANYYCSYCCLYCCLNSFK